MRDDVEVHGSNPYCAVLSAATGVVLPQLPYLDDETKGCTPFLSYATLQPAVAAMAESENFGLDWVLIKECRQPLAKRVHCETRFVGYGRCPSAIVENMLGPGGLSCRQELLPYLRRFYGFFKASFFCEKLAIALHQDEALRGSLDRAFTLFKAESGIASNQSMIEFMYEGDDYVFQESKALAFFRFLEVCR